MTTTTTGNRAADQTADSLYLEQISEAVRTWLDYEATAELICSTIAALEIADKPGFDRLSTLDKTSLLCRECFVRGFAAAAEIAAQINAMPDPAKLKR